MAKILIVEDNLTLNQSLTSIADKRQIQTISAIDLAEAKHKIDLYTFDLVLIDRHLPDGDGLDLIEYINENSPSTRILMLTSQAEVADRVEGLELGADDYLAKPFNYDELFLRIDSLLQKQKLHVSPIYIYGNVSFNAKSRVLRIDNVEWILRKKEALVLGYLLQRANQVVSREDLLYAIWRKDGREDVHPRTVDVNLRRLRLRLGHYNHYLQSIRGAGYRFNVNRYALTY